LQASTLDRTWYNSTIQQGEILCYWYI